MRAKAHRTVRALLNDMADPAASDDDRVVLPRRRGRLRLLAGMVLANRPWLLVPGLKSALVAALATGAVATINSTVWMLADSLSWWRLVVATVVSIALVVGWLVIDGELWDRPADDSRPARQRSRLYNSSTVVTLTVGRPHLLRRPLPREPGVGVLRPRPRSDEQLRQHLARSSGPVRPVVVRRVCGDRRWWSGLGPGVRRGHTRRRLLQARGGQAHAACRPTGIRCRPHRKR